MSPPPTVPPSFEHIFTLRIASFAWQIPSFEKIKFTAHYARYPLTHVLCCRSLFSSYQQGADDEGQAHRRSTSHNVRRFTGTAMLMTNRLPEECLVEESLQAADIVMNSLHTQPPPPSDLD